VILLRRLGLALRQYNLTLELLQLRLELVQLGIGLLDDRRDIRQGFAIGRDLPQFLRAGLYLQLLQTREDQNEDSIRRQLGIERTVRRKLLSRIARVHHARLASVSRLSSIAPLPRTANET